MARYNRRGRTGRKKYGKARTGKMNSYRVARGGIRL